MIRARRTAGTAWAALLLLATPAAAQRSAAEASSPAAAERSVVHVRVTGPDGEGVAGATVELWGPYEPRSEGAAARSGAESGPEGVGGSRVPLRRLPGSRFGSPPLPSGRYRVRASAPGHAVWERLLALAPGEGRELEARLRPAVALEDLVARVLPAAGAAAGHATDRVRFDERTVAAATLGEWLGGLPGVDLRRRGPGGRQVVSVRGSRPEGVLVLLDGMPLNDPLTGAADLSMIPTSTLESATLVRGAVPGAGPGALGGVLLLRSRRASGTGVSLGVDAGSFGRVGTDVHLGAAGERGSVALAARYEEARNDFGFRNRVHPEHPLERRRNADHRSWHGSLAGAPAALPLDFRLRWDRAERGAPGRMGTRLFDEARWREAAWQAGVGSELGRWLSIDAGARVRSMRYRDPRVGTDERHGASDLRVSARLRPDPEGRWLASVRLGVERAGGDRLAHAPARGRLGASVGRRVGGRRLEVRPSLALDGAAGEVAWSPSVAVTARPDRRSTLWARVGRAFRPPTFSDLNFASARGVRPNPDLEPERVQFDGEIGAAWGGADGDVLLRAAAFTRLTKAPIVWLPSSVAVWSPRNLERLVARGLEVDVSLEPVDGWRLEASGTAERSRLGSGGTGRPLPYLPALRGRVAVERSGPATAARLELRAVGERVTTLAGTHALPAFAVLDLVVRARLEPGAVPLTMRLGLRNALDARYELVELFPEPGRTVEVGITVGPIPDG